MLDQKPFLGLVDGLLSSMVSVMTRQQQALLPHIFLVRVGRCWLFTVVIFL